MKLAFIAGEIQHDVSDCFEEVLHTSWLSYRKTRSILIDVLECFFRVKGLAFVHYTCYRDGKKNTAISSCESNSVRRIKGEREPRTDREKSTLFELS